MGIARRVRGFMATTDPLSVYGGVQLPEQAIRELVEMIRLGPLPLQVQHDDRYRLNPKVIVAEVRRTTTGSLGAWVELELDPDEWNTVADMKGFSVATIGNYSSPDLAARKPILLFSADAGEFDRQDYEAAVRKLSDHFAVGGGNSTSFPSWLQPKSSSICSRPRSL